jgi:hypothetical protein
MDNLEKVAALGTQDTGRRQKKQKKTTQKIKKMSNTDIPPPPNKTGVELLVVIVKTLSYAHSLLKRTTYHTIAEFSTTIFQ